MKISQERILNVIDLFSGAGGMSLGFELEGHFKVLAAVDNWEPACQTIKLNNPEINVICQDLNGVDAENNDTDSIIGKLSKYAGQVDVILGGPPCQGMSLAGKRLGSDPRNQLFKAFVEIVGVLKPRCFVMENVVGLLTAEKGKIRQAIVDSFGALGYKIVGTVPPPTLCAEWYGVPQHRRRVFFVGFRKEPVGIRLDDDWIPAAEFKTYDIRDFSNNGAHPLFEILPRPITVREAMSDLPIIQSGEGEEEMDYPVVDENMLTQFQRLMRDWSDCPYPFERPVVYNHVAPNHTSALIERIRKAKPGESVDPKYADSRKWNPDLPSFTVKALGAGGGSTNRRAFHYNKKTPRGSTVRENARIQSFPDWYRFCGAKTHQMSQVGNAVPPLLAKAVANQIYRSLKDGN